MDKEQSFYLLVGFVETVRNMRQCQSDYFKTRNKEYLFKSKALEKQIDNFISNFKLNTIKHDENSERKT